MSSTTTVRWGRITSIILLSVLFLTATAKENSNMGSVSGKRALKNSAVDCEQTTSSVFLDINNVRAMLQVGGDMWWDLNSNPKYIIPKVDATSGETERSSIFAGALWIGGVDPQGALKLAPQHINIGGVCHGGVYMSLADVTMGAAAHSAADRQRCATIDFQAHFLAAAKLDQWLVAEAKLNRMVSGIVFMECELWAGGRHCMRANGIWKLLNLPPRT